MAALRLAGAGPHCRTAALREAAACRRAHAPASGGSGRGERRSARASRGAAATLRCGMRERDSVLPVRYATCGTAGATDDATVDAFAAAMRCGCPRSYAQMTNTKSPGFCTKMCTHIFFWAQNTCIHVNQLSLGVGTRRNLTEKRQLFAAWQFVAVQKKEREHKHKRRKRKKVENLVH